MHLKIVKKRYNVHASNERNWLIYNLRIWNLELCIIAVIISDFFIYKFYIRLIDLTQAEYFCPITLQS